MEASVPHLNWIDCLHYNAKSSASHCNRLSLEASLVSAELRVLEVEDAAYVSVKKTNKNKTKQTTVYAV